MTYVDELPLAFRCNEVCVVSDGPGALCGTAFTPFEHFAPWSVDDDGHPVKQPAVRDVDQPIMLLLHGMFRHARFLDLLTGYVAFARTDGGLVKRLAKPHQYFAVAEAVGKTIEAVRGDGRAGVVWHTQGSGKSMEMELYANQILTHPSLGNPTIVVLTDRTDLDDQLFDTFQASDLLPEKPLQVGTRDELRTELANRRMGGIIFTTLQKFGRTKEERENGWPHPLLSDRRNVIVIVDEAHRSHYDDLNGYARHLRDALPHATFIAFTGTPISFADRNTRDVFGEYIELIYDLTQAVEDGATVPVYYESRLIELNLPKGMDPERHRRGGRRGHRGPGRLRARAHPAAGRRDERRLRRPGPGPQAQRGRRRALGGPQRRDAQVHRRPRQGHDRLRHPGDLRRPVRANYRHKAGLAQRRHRQGQDQGRLHRRRDRRAEDPQARPPPRAEQGHPAARQGPG